MQNIFSSLGNRWKQWRYKGWTLLVLGAAILVLIGLILLGHGKAVTPEGAKALPEVKTQTVDQISTQATVDTTTSLEVTKTAPLVARLGGRVTAINAPLGAKVGPGQVVVQIDGNGEANVARVQADSAAISLGLFADIEKQTLSSLDNAVAIAQNSLQAAKAGRGITAEIQQKNQAAAEGAVDQAQVAPEKTEAGGYDLLIRSANLSVTAAKLAQDQAALAQRLSTQQTGDAVKQAERNAAGAQIARQQTLATLESQKAGLTAQLRVANEQVKLMQVTAPLFGQVSRLTVKVGDFVRPGDIVGEVSGAGAARITLFVPQGVRDGLQIGQVVSLTIDNQVAQGTVQAMAATASGASALWQVDIGTGASVTPSSTVTVNLPISPVASGTIFLPLDALNVRENGIIFFTVSTDNIVHEHIFTPVHYYNHLAEGKADIPSDAHIVVSGNRTLHDGDTVTVAK